MLTQLSNGKQYLDQAPKVSLHALTNPSSWFLTSLRLILYPLVRFLSQHLAFSCGVVRGALSNLGLDSVVTAEVSVMPSCKYQSEINNRLTRVVLGGAS